MARTPAGSEGKSDFMPVAEVARALGLSKSRTYCLIHARRVPAVRVGHSFRTPRAAFEKWRQLGIDAALASCIPPSTVEDNSVK